MKKIFPTYEEAKKIVMDNGIKSLSEYTKHSKELGLPACPNDTYKEKGWVDSYDFLGKERPMSFPSYEEAKKIIQENKIKSQTEYRICFKKFGLHSTPENYYKEWNGWYDYLGKETPISFPPYEEAKKIVQEKGIKTREEYKKYYKDLGLPSTPPSAYKTNGWNGWYDFLGKTKPTDFPSYEDAKRIVQMNGIKSITEYKRFYKELGLPSNLHTIYKDSGWTDAYDFFGTSKPISSSSRKTKVYTTLSIRPVLLEDDAPLQIVYMLASQIDKKLASEIEELLNTASCEDRLNMVKEQLKSLKSDAEPMSVSPRECVIGELSAMESMMDVFEDTLDSLPEDTTAYLNNIIKNYYHNATNRALIAEYDD